MASVSWLEDCGWASGRASARATILRAGERVGWGRLDRGPDVSLGGPSTAHRASRDEVGISFAFGVELMVSRRWE